MQNHFHFALALPEILLLVLTAAILLIDAFSKTAQRHLTFVLSLGALLAVNVVSALQWSNSVAWSTVRGLYVVDSLSHLLKIASYFAVAVTLIYGRSYAEERDMLGNGGELYTLTLFALL